MIETALIEGDSAIFIATAEIKAPISVVFKARVADIDVRAFKIHIRMLRSCIVVIKIRLIDSDVVRCIKIERGPTTSRK